MKEKVKTTYGNIQLFIQEAYDDYGDKNARGFKDFLKARLQKAKEDSGCIWN